MKTCKVRVETKKVNMYIICNIFRGVKAGVLLGTIFSDLVHNTRCKCENMRHSTYFFYHPYAVFSDKDIVNVDRANIDSNATRNLKCKY